MTHVVRARNCRGGILLETILSLLVVTLGIGAMAGLFDGASGDVLQARMRTRAMLLADSKIAELQLGLTDFMETNEGTFDGRPPNFHWLIEEEPTEVDEMTRLKLTIIYDDPADGFELSVYRYFSPSLNFSFEKMTEIASDPEKLMELKSPGFRELLGEMNEAAFPGAEHLVAALMAGGVGQMMALFNKIMSGRISPEELLMMMAPDTLEGVADPISSMMASLTEEETDSDAWSDYDTAGIGGGPVDSVLADAGSEMPGEGESVGEVVEGEVPEAPSMAERPSRGRRGTSRREAINNIMRMMRRLARDRK